MRSSNWVAICCRLRARRPESWTIYRSASMAEGRTNGFNQEDALNGYSRASNAK
jgi:hypothetical protein